MESYFRCGDRTGACPRSRTGAVCAATGWTCPANNPRCQEMREPAPLTAVYRREIRWGLLALGIVLAVLGLFFLFRTDPLQKELQSLTARAQVLDTRLIDLRSKPTTPSAGANALTVLNGLSARAHELEAHARQAVETGDANDAHNDCEQLGDLARRAEDARKSARTPGSNSGTVAMDARQEVAAGEELEGQVEGLRQRVNGKPALVTACETLSSDLQETVAGFRKLLKTGERPPDDAELARLATATQTSYTNAQEALAAMPPPTIKPTAPFDDKNATLIVGCTSDLAASLLLPLLRARTDGKVVSVEPGKWYYTAGAGGPAVERVLIRQSGTTNLADSFRAGVDLVVTEHEPSASEVATFAQAYPGSDLGSRAVAEVVALDALTFLVHPNGRTQGLGPDDVRETKNWVGGVPGSPEEAAAKRFDFVVRQPVNGSVADAMLTRPNDIGLGVYHLEGTTSRARQLTYQGGGQALRPSPFTVATEDYKYSYRVIAYQNPRARPDSVNFVRFITSDKGQETVAAQGYVDLRLRPSGGDVNPVILSTIAHALGLKSIRSAVRLSTNFRFRTGVDHLDLNHAEVALDLKAQADLVRLPLELAREYPRAKVVILGFTDNKGTAGTNQPLSLRRADGVSALLKQAGVDTRTAGLSDQLPVDTNDTEEGRARNRRCEIWVVPQAD